MAGAHAELSSGGISAPLFVLLACVCLAACGGGGGSGSGALGGGQDPDPVIVDYPIAYVKRPLLLDDDGNLQTFDVRDPETFMPGAELFVRDRASPSAKERNITAGVFPKDKMGNPPQYDVKDLSSSFDGKQLLFAMRAPMDPDKTPEEQPTWNIWLYNFDAKHLRRVIPSDIVAEDGQDIAPRFLPDGRIVFASTRQRQSKAILLDEGKPQFSALEESRQNHAFTLHVMNADGSDIHQISFNQSHDFDPAVMTDGRVMYSRWDQIAGRDRISLYSMNPDGTSQHVLYGVHSHDTGPNGETIEFASPQTLPDGRVLASMRPSTAESHLGSAPVAIDVGAYTDHDQPTFANQGLIGDAQEMLLPGAITLDDTPSPRGRFASVDPLFDGTERLLVTWSECRLIDPKSPPPPAPQTIVPCTPALLAMPNIQQAPPLYGVWMFDPAKDAQQPIVTPKEGFAYTAAVVMQARTAPPVILDKEAGLDLDADLVSEGVGVIHIRNVYEIDGTSAVNINALRDPAVTTAAQRPARFLRIEKAVSMPDKKVADFDNTAFGASSANLMREILGYAPIEPDGSLEMKVPANVAFMVSVLDVDGRRITRRHQNWLQLKPGEVMECNGCHDAQGQLPHGRPDAEPPSTNTGAPVDGSPFPNTEPALFANAGETMAQTYARINGIHTPSVDIRFTDVWTDPAVRAKDPSFAYNYSALTTPAPVAAGCVTSWVSSCRIVINYPTHIQPLWDAPRLVHDAMGNVIANNTCTTCHGLVDAMGNAQLPAAELDLSATASAAEPAHFVSYRNLFFQDGRTVQPTMSTAGANASSGFFSVFAPGGTHAGRLTPAELKLLSEWVDIGGQYYNDPFQAPQN